MGTRRRALHLHREPGARIHAVRLAVRVRDLLSVDRVERDADADTRSVLGRVLDEDEFALARLGDVAEERGRVFVF